MEGLSRLKSPFMSRERNMKRYLYILFTEQINIYTVVFNSYDLHSIHSQT